MSDSAPPPFTQSIPELHYNVTGQAWYNDGTQWKKMWKPAPEQQQPSIGEHDGGLTQIRSQLSASIWRRRSLFFAHLLLGQSASDDLTLLPPLPMGDDRDLHDPRHIIRSRGLQEAPKVAGSRRKKGKRARSPSSDSDSDSVEHVPATKHGRPQGSSNFTTANTGKLLDLVEKYLPVGEKGWKKIKAKFAKWARKNGRPERGGQSLENKYKQLIRTKKPTGDAYCPPDIKHAHRLKASIKERAATHELNDSDYDADADAGGESSDDDAPSAPVCTAVACHAALPSTETLAQMPPTSSTRYHDSNATNDNLCNQMLSIQTRVHDAERARDRAELRLEMLQAGNSGVFGKARSSRQALERSNHLIPFEDQPDVVRVDGNSVADGSATAGSARL
ncbi:hypothetical protein C8R43DRAFT_1136322 [Mycena crocata]|nr:hypothetical protein C8R43DRAFT_1136322 [Mycena crocata]